MRITTAHLPQGVKRLVLFSPLPDWTTTTLRAVGAGSPECPKLGCIFPVFLHAHGRPPGTPQHSGWLYRSATPASALHASVALWVVMRRRIRPGPLRIYRSAELASSSTSPCSLATRRPHERRLPPAARGKNNLRGLGNPLPEFSPWPRVGRPVFAVGDGPHPGGVFATC